MHVDVGSTASLIKAAGDRPTAQRGLHGLVAWLGVASTLVMLVVLLQGTLVTNTGSQAGCGDTWPLCKGKIIPELSGVASAATLIEFTHRIMVPLATLLIVAFSGGLVLHWRTRIEVKVLVPSMLFFLLLQALLGGLAVMYPTSAGVLALHFGVSLLSFASVLLASVFVIELGGGERVRDIATPDGFRILVWGTLLFTYLQVYLGAYVRHVGASLACIDWPLCRGSILPPLDQYVVAQLGHRFGALLLTLLVCWLWLAARSIRRLRPDLFRVATLALFLVLLQIVSGGIVVLSLLATLSTLLHSLLITLFFGCVSILCYHSVPLSGSDFEPESSQ